MKVRLYHFPATRSARVAFLLYELADQVDLEIIRLDLYKNAQHSREFVAKFPLHAIPAVEIEADDGQTFTISESAAIIVALADAYPQKALAPSPFPLTGARADYLKLINICCASLDMMLWQIRMHRHILAEQERDYRTVDRYCGKISSEVAPMFASRLNLHSYICGPDFTAADCMISHAIMWARSYGLLRDDTFTNYLSIISERPAFQKAYQDRSEFTPQVPFETIAKGLFTG